MAKWNHKSLEWIHKVRKQNYERTKDKSNSELLEDTRRNTAKVIESLGLKIIRPQPKILRTMVRDKPRKQ